MSILDKANKKKVQPLTIAIFSRETSWYGGDMNDYPEFTDQLHEFILNCPPNKLKSKLYWNTFWKGTEGRYNAGHKTTLMVTINSYPNNCGEGGCISIYIRACRKIGSRASDFVCIADWDVRFKLDGKAANKMKIWNREMKVFNLSVLK